ncbi:MAG TPA: hypothetical protein VF862_13235 [Gemmatimonadales bacterium]
MKLLLVIYSGSTPGRVTDLLDRLPVEGYTEIDRAHGAGRTGRRLGTRAWPGESTVLFTLVRAEDVLTITRAISVEAKTLPEGERLHLAVLPVETVL